MNKILEENEIWMYGKTFISVGGKINLEENALAMSTFSVKKPIIKSNIELPSEMERDTRCQGKILF